MALSTFTLRDKRGNTFESFSIPQEIITGTGSTPKPRLRVDPGQTAFFEGREFRSFKEFSIAAGATLVMRFTSAVDFVLHTQRLTVLSGTLRFAAVADATSGGSFSTIPNITVNRMSTAPVVTSQCVFASGGTSTGGTETDVQLVSAVSDGGLLGGAAVLSVGNATDEPRGLPAGVYHLRFQNTSSETAVGVYALSWSEQAAPSIVIST